MIEAHQHAFNLTGGQARTDWNADRGINSGLLYGQENLILYSKLLI